jgi:hypothetical protein
MSGSRGQPVMRSSRQGDFRLKIDDDDDDRTFLLKTAQECRQRADAAMTPNERAHWLEMSELFLARARDMEDSE